METLWVKVRLLDDNVPLYADAHGGTVLAEAKGHPVIDIAAGNFGDGMRPAMMGNGRQGFIPATVGCVALGVWSTKARQTSIFRSPDVTSGALVTLKAGSLLEQYGPSVEYAGRTWLYVSGPGGETGYVDAGSALEAKGTQVRVQTGSNGFGQMALMKDGKIVAPPVDRSTVNDAANRQMMIGAGLFVVGLIITVITYSIASDGGGTYLICWGPVVFGAIRFFKGLSARSS
jgi:hypothetical protein